MKLNKYLNDLEPEFQKLWNRVNPFTVSSIEQGYSIFKSIEYIIKNKINGDLVECGIGHGGLSMLMALSLIHFNCVDRNIWCYDTFTEPSNPTERDIIIWSNKSIISKVRKLGRNKIFKNWSFPDEIVKHNLSTTSYPNDKIILVKGDVKTTLKVNLPGSICFLRLDTDWYESIKVELQSLYPRLNKNGVIMIDDYGYFLGVKDAVNEYFKSYDFYPLFHKVDRLGIIAVKV